MIKDDTKDQIPLFEVPAAKKEEPPSPTARPAVPAKVPETAAANKPVKMAHPAPVAGKSVKGTAREEGATRKVTTTGKRGRTAAPALAKAQQSGQVPEGDVRLTANIREELHLKLKIAAARRRTTIGELIEELVEKYL